MLCDLFQVAKEAPTSNQFSVSFSVDATKETNYKKGITNRIKSAGRILLVI